MSIYPVPTNAPSFIDPERCYSLSRFIKDSGCSYDRIKAARRAGIELQTIDVGKRKWVMGAEGIAFIRRLAEHFAASKRQG